MHKAGFQSTKPSSSWQHGPDKKEELAKANKGKSTRAGAKVKGQEKRQEALRAQGQGQEYKNKERAVATEQEQ